MHICSSNDAPGQGMLGRNQCNCLYYEVISTSKYETMNTKVIVSTNRLEWKIQFRGLHNKCVIIWMPICKNGKTQLK